jgi:two-component system cell cycle sensor histidine kinase/response regulator CckA
MEAVSRLAGGVAHQFNNLLTSILATADLALESRELPAQLRADLEDIREAGQRASAITRQLLAFSGSQSLAPRETDVTRLIGQLEPLLTHLMTPGVSLEIRAQSMGVIETDPVRLEQVILNLVANAVDAMPHGGAIRISTDNVDAVPETQTTSPAHAHTRISITDTGIGMDEHVRARVFEPFFSAKGLTSGIGLGLASVYGTMQQLGGGVTIQSSLGQGTRVELYLPRWLTPAVTPSSLPAVEEIPAVPAEVVLVVEDEAIVRAPICRMLRTLGYFVLEANNGEDALLVMQEYHSPIHLVVTDVMMPEMDGPSLVAMLRDWYPRMKVLYISGYSNEYIEARGGQVNGSAFLPKPFSLQTLSGRVREILDAP